MKSFMLYPAEYNENQIIRVGLSCSMNNVEGASEEGRGNGEWAVYTLIFGKPLMAKQKPPGLRRAASYEMHRSGYPGAVGYRGPRRSGKIVWIAKLIPVMRQMMMGRKKQSP
jgi:hypothetical protein